MVPHEAQRRSETRRALVAAALLLVGFPVTAAADPRRVELAVAAESEIFARVVGQTADLPLAPVAVAGVWTTPDALRVSIETPAAEGPAVVIVSDPLSGRTLRREVPSTAQGGLAASARAEAIALVVRSGLVELLAAAPATEVEGADPPRGPEPRRRARERASPVDPHVVERTAQERMPTEGADARDASHAPATPSAEAPAEPAEPTAEGNTAAGTLGLSVRVGVHAAFDGTVPPPQVAPELGLGVRLGPFGLALVGGYGLVLESRDTASVVELQRHHVTLECAYAFDTESAAGIALALRGGLYALERATRVRAGDYLATADRTTLSPLVGARARLLVPLAGGPAARHGLALLFEAGADLVPGAPTLAYEQDGAAVERNRLWLVEPALGLGLEYIVRP